MKQKKKRERKVSGLRRRLREDWSDSLIKVCKIYFILESFDIDKCLIWVSVYFAQFLQFTDVFEA